MGYFEDRKVKDMFLVYLWFLIGFVFLGIGFTKPEILDPLLSKYPNFFLYFYLLWFVVLGIAGWLISRNKNKK